MRRIFAIAPVDARPGSKDVSTGRQVDAENERAERELAVSILADAVHQLQHMVSNRSFPAATTIASIRAATNSVGAAIVSLRRVPPPKLCAICGTDGPAVCPHDSRNP